MQRVRVSPELKSTPPHVLEVSTVALRGSGGPVAARRSRRGAFKLSSCWRLPLPARRTPPRPRQDYVRVRLTQFLGLLSGRLGHYAPGLPAGALERAAADALACMPPGDHGQLSLEDKQLQLVFRHDCL
jgi:hypothetical protein